MKQGRYTNDINYRWDPDCDLKLVRDPSNPSARTRRRHHKLLDMLLAAGDLDTVCKITAAYPYLRADIEDRLNQVQRREELWEKQAKAWRDH